MKTSDLLYTGGSLIGMGYHIEVVARKKGNIPGLPLFVSGGSLIHTNNLKLLL